jgi:hypothetical protein
MLLPYAKRSPEEVRRVALMCLFWMGWLDPTEVFALFRERREMRDALDRWADDGGAFHG